MRNKLILIAALAFTTPAVADIAVLTSGRIMKVESYVAGEKEIELVLAGGGKVLLPLDRIERIVDDEVVPVVAAVNPQVTAHDGKFPKRSWKFEATRLPLFKSQYDHIIFEASKKFDVDASLVSAVIKAESDYQPKIVSHKGARGLMQLMPATAKRFGVKNSFDPQQNIHGGTRYLAWLLKTFDGNADLAVAAYNAGEGNVWKYDGVPPFRETINYVKKISKNFRNESSASGSSASIVAVASR